MNSPHPLSPDFNKQPGNRNFIIIILVLFIILIAVFQFAKKPRLETGKALAQKEFAIGKHYKLVIDKPVWPVTQYKMSYDPKELQRYHSKDKSFHILLRSVTIKQTLKEKFTPKTKEYYLEHLTGDKKQNMLRTILKVAEKRGKDAFGKKGGKIVQVISSKIVKSGGEDWAVLNYQAVGPKGSRQWIWNIVALHKNGMTTVFFATRDLKKYQAAVAKIIDGGLKKLP